MNTVEPSGGPRLGNGTELPTTHLDEEWRRDFQLPFKAYYVGDQLVALVEWYIA